jgi:LysR family transcriptional regulator for bpeEF and oprC
LDKLRGISWFCRVVETGSFAGAARSLDVVPSALSKTIAGLERELGFSLMNRSTRHLSLTEEGALYYERCRQLLEDLEQTEVNARDRKLKPRGTLRVGLHPAFRGLVLRSLGRFMDEQPELRVETLLTNSVSDVLEEGLDLLLHIGELADSGLVAQRIAMSRSVVCASPTYIAARGEPRHPLELLQHRVLVYNRHDEASNATWSFVRGEENVVVRVPVRMVSRDGLGVVDAMVGGCGIGKSSEFAVRPLAASKLLTILLPDWRASTKHVHAVWPNSASKASAKSRFFLEFVSSLLRSETSRQLQRPAPHRQEAAEASATGRAGPQDSTQQPAAPVDRARPGDARRQAGEERPGRAAGTGINEAREHGPLPRHRGGRRTSRSVVDR